MDTNPAMIIAALIGLFLLYVLCRLFIRPLKWLLKLLLSCALGCLAMLLANKLLSDFGISFALNPLTAALSGILGLPGMALTLILQNIL